MHAACQAQDTPQEALSVVVSQAPSVAIAAAQILKFAAGSGTVHVVPALFLASGEVPKSATRVFLGSLQATAIDATEMVVSLQDLGGSAA